MDKFEEWEVREISDVMSNIIINGKPHKWLGIECSNIDLAHQIVTDHNEVERLRTENKELKEQLTWIHVDERLPEDNEHVFARCFQHGIEYFIEGDMDSSAMLIDYNYELHRPSHWLPIPPLKED